MCVVTRRRRADTVGRYPRESWSPTGKALQKSSKSTGPESERVEVLRRDNEVKPSSGTEPPYVRIIDKLEAEREDCEHVDVLLRAE